MAVLEILIYGDPALREVARRVEAVTPELRQLAADMLETMYAAEGIGLAANQIGSLDRIVVVDTEWRRGRRKGEPAQPGAPMVMLNPEIVEESVEDDESEEGCLSMPGLRGDVWRSIKIKVRYETLEGEQVERELKGLTARCAQHEVDHLNGVLFIDRMPKAGRQALTKALAKLVHDAKEKAAS